MKAWFVELRDARPWGLATLVVLALCSVFLDPNPQVDLLTLASLPLLIFCLKQWKLLHCRWLYIHALIVWWPAYLLNDTIYKLCPTLHTLSANTEYSWYFVQVLLTGSTCAFAVACISLPLLHRFIRTTASLPRLFTASVLLWLVLQKSLFFLSALVALCTATRL